MRYKARQKGKTACLALASDWNFSTSDGLMTDGYKCVLIEIIN